MTDVDPIAIALVDTIIGNSVPSYRRPVISTSVFCAEASPSDAHFTSSSLKGTWRADGRILLAGWPTMSVAVQPNIASAAVLNERIVPSNSTVKIPSAAFSTTAL